MTDSLIADGDVEVAWRPLGGHIGAEVLDLDVRTLSSARRAQCRELLMDRGVLVFRDQHLTPPELIAFSSHWGDRYESPNGSDKKSSDHPELIELRNVGKSQTDTEVWHSDVSFLERPPAMGILSAAVVPVGGDTMFANQYVAYESLSSALRAVIDPLGAVHEHLGLAAKYGLPDPRQHPVVHPVVRTHPETGRRLLYVNAMYTKRFDGMTEDESAGLLAHLTARAVSPEICYRHRWQVGDLVMWDNRCTQHYAIHDYGDQERVLYRAAIAGDRPL